MTAQLAHEDEYGRWEPLTLAEVAGALRPTGVIWCIAGGYAPELFVGRSWRSHEDVDVVILRREAEALHRALPGWSLHLAGLGNLEAWPAGTALPEDIHDVWVRQGNGPWRFQFMVVDTEDGDWLYRREPQIRGPLETLTVDVGGLPVLAPEIQLLYKSKHPNRPKDERDAEVTIPVLDPSRRERLRSWLAFIDPNHPWLETSGLLAPPDQEASAR